MLHAQTHDTSKQRPLPKVNTAARLPVELLARLDAYIDRQKHPTTRTVIIEEAIKSFLEREGA